VRRECCIGTSRGGKVKYFRTQPSRHSLRSDSSLFPMSQAVLSGGRGCHKGVIHRVLPRWFFIPEMRSERSHTMFKRLSAQCSNSRMQTKLELALPISIQISAMARTAGRVLEISLGSKRSFYTIPFMLHRRTTTILLCAMKSSNDTTSCSRSSGLALLLQFYHRCGAIWHNSNDLS
jgi:hypothetical protein